MGSDGHRVQSKDQKNREIGRLVASFAFLLVIAAEEGSMLPLLNIFEQLVINDADFASNLYLYHYFWSKTCRQNLTRGHHFGA
jgi:hypothetical protein